MFDSIISKVEGGKIRWALIIEGEVFYSGSFTPRRRPDIHLNCDHGVKWMPL